MPWFKRDPDLLEKRKVECVHEGIGDATEVVIDCPICLEKVTLRSRSAESELFLGTCPCCYTRFHLSNVKRKKSEFHSPGYRSFRGG